MSTEPMRVAFLGLGQMGLPMAKRLMEVGYRLVGYDTASVAVDRFVAAGGTAAASAAEASTASDVTVLMLPNSDVVSAVVDDLMESGGLADGAILVDMSSSEPHRTRTLAATLAGRGVIMIDAPVSGGVAKAGQGTLAVMVGGDDREVGGVEELLSSLGRVFRAGPVGSGHAVKALNNLMSAVHLVASSEAIVAGKAFGLDAGVFLDIVNASSGRSGSTEDKWPKFVLTGSFDSGFSLKLMLKDMRTALALADEMGASMDVGRRAVEVWTGSAAALPDGADHTEIARWIENLRQHDEPGNN